MGHFCSHNLTPWKLPATPYTAVYFACLYFHHFNVCRFIARNLKVECWKIYLCTATEPKTARQQVYFYKVWETRGRGRNIFLKLAVLILSFYAQPSFFFKIIWCNDQVNILQYTTLMVFHSFLVQITNYGDIHTIVFMLVFHFLSVLFFTFFQTMFSPGNLNSSAGSS